MSPIACIKKWHSSELMNALAKLTTYNSPQYSHTTMSAMLDTYIHMNACNTTHLLTVANCQYNTKPLVCKKTPCNQHKFFLYYI